MNFAGNLAKEPLVTHMMMKTCILYFYANGLFGVDKQRFICAFVDTLGIYQLTMIRCGREVIDAL